MTHRVGCDQHVAPALKDGPLRRPHHHRNRLQGSDTPPLFARRRIVSTCTVLVLPSTIKGNDLGHLEEESIVIPPTMPNLLQDNVEKSKDDVTENEKLTASCENSEPSTITPAEHESKGNAHDAKLTEGESSLDVPNFSTNHAMIEQILVEHSLDLPLSQDDLLDVSCDKDDLHDEIYVIPMQP